MLLRCAFIQVRVILRSLMVSFFSSTFDLNFLFRCNYCTVYNERKKIDMTDLLLNDCKNISAFRNTKVQSSRTKDAIRLSHLVRHFQFWGPWYAHRVKIRVYHGLWLHAESLDHEFDPWYLSRYRHIIVLNPKLLQKLWYCFKFMNPRPLLK